MTPIILFLCAALGMAGGLWLASSHVVLWAVGGMVLGVLAGIGIEMLWWLAKGLR